MTRPTLVLVTGSRALAEHAEARAWLRSELDARRPAVVATGDAAGPDAFASSWCADRHAHDAPTITDLLAPGMEHPILAVYALDGSVRVSTHPRVMVSWSGCVSPPPFGDPARKRWPLKRNAAMVRDVAVLSTRYIVTVLALRASWSPTNGTGHTIGLARTAGLPVEERVFDRSPASNPPLPRVGS